VVTMRAGNLHFACTFLQLRCVRTSRFPGAFGVTWALLERRRGRVHQLRKSWLVAPKGQPPRNLSGNRDRVRHGNSEAAGDRGGALLRESDSSYLHTRAKEDR
jgi:hypothetical protein